MKTVFFGTPGIAAHVLESLIASKHEVLAVVTQPDRVSGRGREVSEPPVKALAAEHNITVLQPEKVNDASFLSELKAIGAELHVVTAYAQKLPSELLNMAPAGCINVHPSLLPRYRGAVPIPAAILNGDTVSGVTIMRMAERMDAGDILLQEEIALAPDETTCSLEKKSAEIGSGLLIRAIDMLESGTLTGMAQDESLSTYVGQLKKEDGLMDFKKSAVRLERETRAYNPWPGSFTYLEGKLFKIWKAAALPDGSAQGPAGEIIYADKKTVKVRCGEGTLELLEVQLQGKKRMSTEEFLRGRKIKQGCIFGK